MINKILCLALASALLLGGCSSGKLPGELSVNHSRATSSVPSMPSLASATPQLIVFTAVSPAPSEASPLNLTAEDMDQIRSYWPLKQRKIGDMGTLCSVGVTLIGTGAEKSLMIMYGFKTDIAFDDLCKDLQVYIPGSWKIKKDVSASVVKGKAEGSFDVSCTIDESSKMIALGFVLTDRHDEVTKILDAHWPDGLMEIPGDFSEPYAEDFSMNPGTMSYTKAWNVPNSKEAFNQIAESASGRTGFTHLKLKSRDIDDSITFIDGDVTVDVYFSQTLGRVTIIYTLHSSPFPAPTPVTVTR